MSKIKILIVEDESIVALDLENRLKKNGHAVLGIASNGQEAINQAAISNPDLVLMDINLKGSINGIEAAREIYIRFDIPVIYLTANADSDTFERAKTTAPIGYLLKPFKERELNQTIEVTLSRYKAERKLKESEQWLATVLKSIGDAVIASDAFETVTFMNPVAEVLTGWKHSDAFGKNVTEVFNIIHESTRTLLEIPVTQALQAGVVVGLPEQTMLIARNAVEIPIDYNVAPIKDDLGNIKGVVLVFQDITERKRTQSELRRVHNELETRVQERTTELATANKELQLKMGECQQAELALRSSLATNRALLNAIPDLMFRISKDGTFVNFKAAKDNNLLLPSSEFLGKNMIEVLPHEVAIPIMNYVELTLSSGELQIFEFQLVVNNNLLDYEARIAVSAENEVMAIIRNVTERKRADKQIKASLKEKEVLLKEIHHRVKKNLQIISSLLKLQSRHSNNSQTLEMFKESQSRIQTMALIHEKLYQSNDLSKVNFAEYIKNLVANLFRSYELNLSQIKSVINVEDIFLEIDVAVPCGLMLNELISNSLKYAFPDGRAGEIKIQLYADNAQNLALIVSDNGVGFPKDLDWQNLTSLQG